MPREDAILNVPRTGDRTVWLVPVSTGAAHTRPVWRNESRDLLLYSNQSPFCSHECAQLHTLLQIQIHCFMCFFHFKNANNFLKE